MKKALVYGFTGLFFAWTITGITYAQDSTSTAKVKLQPPSEKKHFVIN